MLKSKKTKIITGSVIAVTVLVAIVWATYNTGSPATVMGADTVIMSQVNLGDLRQVVTANGTVALERIEPIYSSAQGETRLRVAQVLVEVGDHVEVGQTIVTYDIDEELISINNRIRESEINIQNQILTVQSHTLGPNPQAYNVLVDAIFTAQNGIRTAKEGIVTAQNAIVTAQSEIAVAQANINNANAQIEAARSALTTAQNNLEINQQLLNAGAISQNAFNAFVIAEEAAQNTLNERLNALVQNETTYETNIRTLETRQRELDTAIIALETAERTLANANRDYQVAINPLASQNAVITHAQAQNTLQNLQHSHSSLIEQRNRLITETVSHTSGTVTEVQVAVGAQVTGASKLIDVANFDNLIVNAYIREVDAPLISVGQTVTMTNAGLLGQVFTGTVDFINPIATTRQAQTGTEVVVSIRIIVNNPDESLRPGYSVDIEIIMDESLNTLSIPLMSLILDQETGGFAVFIVDQDNIIRRRSITTGISTATDIEVLEGLNAGDIIILTPPITMEYGDLLPENAVFGGAIMPNFAQDTGGGGGGGVILIN